MEDDLISLERLLPTIPDNVSFAQENILETATLLADRWGIPSIVPSDVFASRIDGLIEVARFV